MEDWSGREIYDVGLATERVKAAAEAEHAGSAPIVLTARAENQLRAAVSGCREDVLSGAVGEGHDRDHRIDPWCCGEC